MGLYTIDGKHLDIRDNAMSRPEAYKINSVNHRGYNTEAPENTLPAFKLSKTHGFDMVETDILFTSDNVPVLIHDTSINRTARNSDGSAIEDTVWVEETSYADLLEYDYGIWFSNDYAGTPIPTLTEFLLLCRAVNLHPYLELKSQRNNITQSELEQLVNTVRDCGMHGKVTYIGYNENYLSAIVTLDPTARVGLLWGVGALTDTGINNALALSTGANDVFIDSATYTSADIALVKAAGIPLEAWTLNTASSILALDPYITGVTSNNLIASDVLYDSVMQQ